MTQERITPATPREVALARQQARMDEVHHFVEAQGGLMFCTGCGEVREIKV